MQEYRYLYESGHLPDAFKRIPLFAALSEKYLKHILQSARIRDYAPGEIIILEGSHDRWIYILLNGKARVVKQGEDIAVLEQSGEVFGELTVIDRQARSASVAAVSKTLCLAVDAATLDTLPPEDRNACYAVIYRLFAAILAERLKHTSEELAHAKQELDALRARK